MRTTINLPDALAEAAKERAAADGRTFTSLVEEGLRRVLDRDTSAPSHTLPVYDAPAGARMLVDPADKQSLGDVLDEGLDLA